MVVGVAVLGVLLVLYAWKLPPFASGVQTTDNAYVRGQVTILSPQLSGDVAEVAAIRRAFGADADHMAISGTKSMTGHLLGAAGALEAVFAVQAVRDRVAPPTINIDHLDPAVDLDIVRDTPRPLGDGDLLVLDNSFGFGGTNAHVVLEQLQLPRHRGLHDMQQFGCACRTACVGDRKESADLADIHDKSGSSNTCCLQSTNTHVSA